MTYFAQTVPQLNLSEGNSSLFSTSKLKSLFAFVIFLSLFMPQAQIFLSLLPYPFNMINPISSVEAASGSDTQTTTTDFNYGTKTNVTVSGDEVTLDSTGDWWDNNYNYRQRISVKNQDPSAAPSTIDAYTTTSIVINTKTLYDASRLQADCDDLRVTFGSSTQTELNRYIDYADGATDCSDSEQTTVYFKTQANISAAGEDLNYYYYYDYSSATTPTSTIDAFDKNTGGSIKNALLAIPFNGDPSGVNASGQASPSTATGAIRYQGQKSAMVFDGSDDYIRVPSDSSANGTIEFWWYRGINADPDYQVLFNKYSSVENDGFCITTSGSKNNGFLFRIVFLLC